MTLREKQSVFALNVSKLIAKFYELGFELSFGETYRPQFVQDIYFKNGKSKVKHSRHLERLAIDFNIFLNGKMLFGAGISTDQYKKELMLVKPVGEYWESLNPDNVWGGDFNRNDVMDETFYDPYHWEMRN